MDNIYSYLHEVWEPEPSPISQVPTVGPQGPITDERNYMEDIMSAYTDRSASPNKPFDIDGYNGPSQHNYYEIEKMYENDIKVLEKQVPNSEIEAHVPVCTQEVSKQLITNIVEPFSAPQVSPQFSELIIFLLSGILLIFMFDRLVHLGSFIVRRK